MVRRSSLLALALFAVSSASHAAAQSSTAPRQLTAHQQLARDIYKELVEINTTTDATPGGTTQAAEAMAARLRAAGFSGGDGMDAARPTTRRWRRSSSRTSSA